MNTQQKQWNNQLGMVSRQGSEEQLGGWEIQQFSSDEPKEPVEATQPKYKTATKRIKNKTLTQSAARARRALASANPMPSTESLRAYATLDSMDRKLDALASIVGLPPMRLSNAEGATLMKARTDNQPEMEPEGTGKGGPTLQEVLSYAQAEQAAHDSQPLNQKQLRGKPVVDRFKVKQSSAVTKKTGIKIVNAPFPKGVTEKRNASSSNDQVSTPAALRREPQKSKMEETDNESWESPRHRTRSSSEDDAEREGPPDGSMAGILLAKQEQDDEEIPAGQPEPKFNPADCPAGDLAAST